MNRRSRILALFTLTLAIPLLAEASDPSANPWERYEFLIGKWTVSPTAGGSPVATAQFRWGPNRSYIWYAGSLILDGVERPHFEGLLVWNGVEHHLDMLLSMDLERGLVQEQGSLHAEADGTVVREITATYAEGSRPIGGPPAGRAGASAHFRQTFKPDGPDRVMTSVLRQTEKGWTATFPGSDRLVMTRKDKG
jgi:hypothetical protein